MFDFHSQSQMVKSNTNQFISINLSSTSIVVVVVVIVVAPFLNSLSPKKNLFFVSPFCETLINFLRLLKLLTATFLDIYIVLCTDTTATLSSQLKYSLT